MNQLGKLINRIPGLRLTRLGFENARWIARQALGCQQAFSKPCLVNLKSKDTHLVLSIIIYGTFRFKYHWRNDLKVVHVPPSHAAIPTLSAQLVDCNLVFVLPFNPKCSVLIDFSLTVKAVTLIFISGRCWASSFAKQEKSGSFYNLVKN